MCQTSSGGFNSSSTMRTTTATIKPSLRFQTSSRKRVDLISQMDKFSLDVRRKLEYWHGVSSILEREVEEKSPAYPDFSLSIGEKLAEMNSFIASLIHLVYKDFVEKIEDTTKARHQVTAAEERVAAMTIQKDHVNEMLKEKNAILKKFLDVGSYEEMKSKKEKRINFITLENMKLAAENQQLAAKLQQVENGEDLSSLRAHLQQTIEDAAEKHERQAREIETKEREIFKRKQQLTSIQAQLSKVSSPSHSKMNERTPPPAA